MTFLAPQRVVLDANVLYPFTLRDTLLRLGAAGYSQLQWTEKILYEMSRNLVVKNVVTSKQAEYLVGKMCEAFPEAMVYDYEDLIDSMANEDKDRHVAAAAVKSNASIIVTNNLKDFRNLPEGIEVQSPDDFLLDIFDFDPDGIVDILRQQAAALKKPSKTYDELLTGLSKTVPKFSNVIQKWSIK